MAVEEQKNRQIELLRAVAIIYTLIHHLLIPLGHLPKYYMWLYPYGKFYIGVDLFFVISGFVITRSLCKSEVNSLVSNWRLMAAFWLKRVFRLLPLAWFWLLIAALITLAIAHLPGEQEKSGFLLAPVLAAFFQVANLYSGYCRGTGTSQFLCDSLNVSGHYWSLSLEEQFYLVYPLIFFMVNRKFLVVALCAAAVAQFFWTRPVGSYAWYFRADGLTWGVLLGLFAGTKIYAAAAERLTKYRFLLVGIMVLMVFLLPIIARQVGGESIVKPYGAGIIALVSAIIVFIASFDLRCVRKNGPISNAMLYLGSRSYSIYVTHFILFYMIAFILGHSKTELGYGGNMLSDIWYSAVSLFIVLVASEFSYRYIENRYRPRGRLLAAQLTKAGRD